MGGSGWIFFIGRWGWVGLGGGIFWMDWCGWTFFMGEWGWVGMGGNFSWVSRSEGRYILGGRG